MTYAVKQDLVDRFGETELKQLIDHVNRPPTTIDDVVVGRALGDADALANGYLGKKYDLPLSTVPPVLTKVCADIARYYLHGKAADKDSQVARDFDAAMSWLKDVARGLVSIGDEGVTPIETGGGAIRANPSSRIFTRDSLSDA